MLFLCRCGHCKKLAPHYTEAAAVLAKHDNIRIAKVDATAHRERANELGVRGYPSVKVFLNGVFHEDYKQAREADAIVKYLRNLAPKATGGAPARTRAPEAATANEPAPAVDDPCLDGDYAADNYGTCCANGGVNKPGHRAVCQEARNRGMKREEL